MIPDIERVRNICTENLLAPASYWKKKGKFVLRICRRLHLIGRKMSLQVAIRFRMSQIRELDLIFLCKEIERLYESQIQ